MTAGQTLALGNVMYAQVTCSFPLQRGEAPEGAVSFERVLRAATAGATTACNAPDDQPGDAA